jgi:drug/metabolite transporter (DMT)-like permease
MPPPAAGGAAATGRPTSRRVLGVALVVCAAICFGVAPSFARLAYQGGVDVLTLTTLRCVVSALVIFTGLRLMGRPTRPPSGTRRRHLALGITMVASSYGYLGAISYIPVGLAVLILFTFPLLVGLISRFTGGEPLTPLRLGAVIVAFLGLALAVGVSFEALDPRGIALALLAAVAISIQITAGASLFRHSGPVMVILHMMLSAGVMLGVALALAGGPVFPDGAAGWLATIGVVTAFLVAILCFFSGLARIGPVPAALVANLEPLVALGTAFVILGETLGPLQLVGAAMVLGAVTAGQLPARRRSDPRRRPASRR